MGRIGDDRRLGIFVPAAVGFAACLFLSMISTDHARAADWPSDIPVLRGSYSAPVARWEGFYVGGQVGFASSDTDFGSGTHDMIAHMLRNTVLKNEQHPEDWTTLGHQIGHATSYGGFIGYNVQWGDVVLGVEGAYNRVSSSPTTVSDSMIRRVTLSTGTDVVAINADESIKLDDYATFRARAGYAFGQFLPYGYVGIAIGRFDYARDVSLVVTGSDNGSFTESDDKNGAIAAGLDVGLGIDVALTPNLFLRGEWEFMAYAPIAGIRYMSNTARAGLGLKF
jgi:opacity protein-like surface antigen